MFPNIFWGYLLRRLRHSHHILQKQLAQVMHCTPQNISSLEGGRTQPSAEEIATLSYIYGTNLFEYVYRCLPEEYLEEQRIFREAYVLPSVRAGKSLSEAGESGSQIKGAGSETKEDFMKKTGKSQKNGRVSSSVSPKEQPDRTRLLYRPDPSVDPLEQLTTGPNLLVADDHPYNPFGAARFPSGKEKGESSP